jgi:pyrroloquinoline quinone biosynthesis protein D
MSTPTLAPHVQLRHDARRSQWVLLAPERVIVLDEMAHAVVSLLDGQRSEDAIAASLARDYDATPEKIAADLREFLEELRGKGLVVP